ncbi:hypothetical protein DOE76_02920 [Leifsonia sp. ku-ls]|nr:hypothetical protein DOE76_02920 [Leifsonia sp. ku-ls]
MTNDTELADLFAAAHPIPDAPAARDAPVVRRTAVVGDAPAVVDEALLLDAPARPGRLEADTAAAIAASTVGALCVIVCAVGLIRVYVEPAGALPVVLAGIVTGVIVCALVAGGVWAWLRDRAHRAR